MTITQTTQRTDVIRRPLGPSGIEASAVAIGTWAIGGWMWGGSSEDDAVRAIHAALDEGLDFLDTAPIYGFGLSESVVGKAIADRRDKVVLATKCGMVCNTTGGRFFFRSSALGRDDDGHLRVHILLSPESIRKELEDSLKRLGTDRIDLYQTHWQEEITRRQDTMGELARLKDEGKIRAIGVSNATAAQMSEYEEVAPLDCDQENFSMLDRRIEDDQLPHTREKSMAMLAYSPLALGILTGKVGPDREFNEGDLRRGSKRFSVENRRKVLAMLEKFQPIADERGITVAQLVIAWTIHRPGLTHALVGMRNERQAKENAAAARVELSPDEIEAMDKAIEEYDGV